MDVTALCEQIVNFELENAERFERFCEVVPYSESEDFNYSFGYTSDEEEIVSSGDHQKEMSSSDSDGIETDKFKTPHKQRLRKNYSYEESSAKRFKIDRNDKPSYVRVRVYDRKFMSKENSSSTPTSSSSRDSYTRYLHTYPPKTTKFSEHSFIRHSGGRSSKRREFLKEINQTEAIPQYKGYQLIGDSQLLRFCEQVLGIKENITFTEDTKSKRLGYCVSGQKINDLERRLLNGEYKIHDKVILLIGTNDLYQNSKLRAMCDSFDCVLRVLQSKAKKIVLLTIPPIPKKGSDHFHWSVLDHFNKYILNKEDGETIFTIDLGSHFVGINNSTINSYFEEVFFDGRTDMLHLNRKGFRLLQEILNINYFDDLNS